MGPIGRNPGSLAFGSEAGARGAMRKSFCPASFQPSLLGIALLKKGKPKVSNQVFARIPSGVQSSHKIFFFFFFAQSATERLLATSA